MSRITRFRAKAIGAGWVYGDLVHMPRSTQIYDQEHGFTPVHDETVGEYTGLHDKNGKPIYEGDIVRCGYDEIFQVKYMVERDYPAFDVEPDIAADCNGLAHLLLGTDDGLEVIGNVHDHPQLLESAQ